MSAKSKPYKILGAKSSTSNGNFMYLILDGEKGILVSLSQVTWEVDEYNDIKVPFALIKRKRNTSSKKLEISSVKIIGKQLELGVLMRSVGIGTVE